MAPAVVAGQCAVMEANGNGRKSPVAVVLWACVSEELDKRLSENPASPARLRPGEWRSGDRVWIVAAEGDEKAVALLLRQLKATAFRSCGVKMRASDPGGRPTVRHLTVPPTE